MKFERENRYIVIKRSDLPEDLPKVFYDTLLRICDAVDQERVKRRKTVLKCVVVEHDWPEYEPTWAAIKKRMEESKRQP